VATSTATLVARRDVLAAVRTALRRPAVAGLVLVAVYAVAILALDPLGQLGGDTGGRVATLAAMAHGGWPHPEVGYWAARLDPAGRLHPMWLTSQVGSRWLTVGTVPILLAAYPLYRLGGYRAVLVFPVAGAVLAAFAARRLSRRLGSVTDGWAAFWAVGLASPVTVYALDFWDHALGLGLMLWGVAELVDLLDDGTTTTRRVARGGAVAGLCFGSAATMRTEAFVYAAAAVLVVGGVLAARRRWSALFASGVGFALVAAGCQVANVLLERAVLGASLRDARSADTLRTAADIGIGGRLQIAYLSGVAVRGKTTVAGIALSVGLVLVVLLAAWAARRGEARLARLAASTAVLLLLVRVAAGWGFVPGLLASTPLAAVGLVWGWRQRVARVLLAISLGGFALVVASQFPTVDANRYTWGGRYVLLSGALAAVVGVTLLERHGRDAMVAVLAVAVAVTTYGVGMLTVRTHDVGAWATALDGRTEDLVVSRIDEPFRDAGAVYTPSRPWLTASDDTRLVEALRIADAVGATTMALVEYPTPDAPAVPGWCRGTVDVVPWVPSAPLRITHLERAAAGEPC
jgi:hypothetical protein